MLLSTSVPALSAGGSALGISVLGRRRRARAALRLRRAAAATATGRSAILVPLGGTARARTRATVARRARSVSATRRARARTRTASATSAVPSALVYGSFVASESHTQLPPVHVLPVRSVHCVFRITAIVEANESESLALPGVLVARNVDVSNVAVFVEEPSEVGDRRVVRDVVHLQRVELADVGRCAASSRHFRS